MNYEKYVLEILNALELDNLDQKEKERFQKLVEKTIEQRLMADIIINLPAKERNNFFELVDQGKNEIEILDYLIKKIPNISEIMLKSIKNTTNEIISSND